PRLWRRPAGSQRASPASAAGCTARSSGGCGLPPPAERRTGGAANKPRARRGWRGCCRTTCALGSGFAFLPWDTSAARIRLVRPDSPAGVPFASPAVRSPPLAHLTNGPISGQNLAAVRVQLWERRRQVGDEGAAL